MNNNIPPDYSPYENNLDAREIMDPKLLENNHKAFRNESSAPENKASMEQGIPNARLERIMNDQGDFSHEWYKQFEELAPHASTLSKFRRPEALAKSYATLERMKGYPGIENSRQMESFRRIVGLPESMEEYKVTRPEGAPDEAWDPALVDKISKLAYEYGIPAPAMDALTQCYCGENRQAIEQQAAMQEESIQQAQSQLQREWGSRYEDNMNSVGHVLQQLGDQANVNLEDLAENPALRANPDFVKLMFEASKLLNEAPLHEGKSINRKDEAHRIAHDSQHPLHEAYMRSSHPQHRYANEQYDRFAFGR